MPPQQRAAEEHRRNLNRKVGDPDSVRPGVDARVAGERGEYGAAPVQGLEPWDEQAPNGGGDHGGDFRVDSVRAAIAEDQARGRYDGDESGDENGEGVRESEVARDRQSGGSA
jgi:hypothetical protein